MFENEKHFGEHPTCAPPSKVDFCLRNCTQLWNSELTALRQYLTDILMMRRTIENSAMTWLPPSDSSSASNPFICENYISYNESNVAASTSTTRRTTSTPHTWRQFTTTVDWTRASISTRTPSRLIMYVPTLYCIQLNLNRIVNLSWQQFLFLTFLFSGFCK